MALSQVQCLDDNHVNVRTHESKAAFLYCEDQRLALEALLRDGRDALVKLQRERGLRGFLSEPEMEALAAVVEPYDPGSELLLGDPEDDDEPPLSLQYWPELSDTSVPQMDLGWPDSPSYRGGTRVSVYAQPPLEGQTHIKEVVRKMIAQAQKVIAVVMDVFTDVDIFRDLLDAGFKRKVSVYILLERTRLPHFLSMCQRANMHTGHLKNLRVRCSEGSEFCTRSCSRVKGQLGHRFMFIDGDKALSGSYSFTWMSSRLDRNLITVLTGQAVDSFDTLFRLLYATSSAVDLRQVDMEPEPEPEPLQQPPPVATPSAADLRKMYNPKYAVLMAGCPGMNPPSGPKEPQKSDSPEVPGSKKKGQSKGSKDAAPEAPPLHPGLSHLEKACLMTYLPTWPEPDPPSDVIGFINIRDSSKAFQVHLQRSERFEKSQAVRFSSPFSMPEVILPEVAQLSKPTPNRQETNKHQATQNKANAEESVVDGNQATQPTAAPDDIKTRGEAPEDKSPTPVKDTNQALDTQSELHSNTTTSHATGHNTAPHHSAPTPCASSGNTSTSNTGRSSHSAQTLTTSSQEPQSLPGSNAEQEAETSLNTQTKTEVSQADSQAQPHNSSETPNVQTPTVHSHIPTSSASPSHPPPVTSISIPKKHLTASTAVNTRTATGVCISLPSTSCSPSVPPPISSSTPLQPPLPPSSAPPPLTPVAPVPKPRTVHLVIKSNHTMDGQKLPEISVVSRPETPAKNSDATNVAQMPPPEKEPESVPLPQNNSGSRTGAEEEAKNTGNPDSKYLARAQEPQRISCCELNGPESAAINAHAPKDSQQGSSPSVKSANHTHIKPKHNAHNSVTAQEPQQAPKALEGSHTLERPKHLPLSNTHVTAERELLPVSGPVRTMTPDAFLPRTPTPDSRTPTPDGYMSSREDSNLSTTSDEYFESRSSPLNDPVFDRAGFNNDATTGDLDGFTHTNAPDAATFTAASPAHVNHTTWAENGDVNEKDENMIKLSVTERPTERGYQARADHHQETIEVVEMDKMAEPPATKSKRVPSQSAAAARGLLDGGGAPGESTNNTAKDGVRPDEKQVEDGAALRPSDRRDRPQSPRETERQKSPRRPQQDGSPSPHRRPRSSPPPVGAVGSATGPKQVKDRHSESQALLRRLPPVTESRTRTGQEQRQHSNPGARAPVVNTHSNSQSQVRPHSQNHEESVPGAHTQEEGKAPFSLTFSKLYSLKGLKDKMSSKRTSTS